MNKRIISFIFCLVLFNIQVFANEIRLRVLGNDQDGYYVNIYWGKQLISDQVHIPEHTRSHSGSL